MSDIARWAAFDGGIAPHPYGKWILYDDHRAEVERLTARQTEMETHITGLTNELHRTRADGIELRWVAAEVEQLTAQRDAAQVEVERLKNALDHLTSERDEAQADVEQLKEQVAALTLAVEQADEMKANAEAAVLVEEAETDRVLAERNAAQVEVYRLENAIDNLTSERDEARAEVEQLTQNLDAWKKDYQELEQERNRARDLGEELNRELEGQKAANQRLLRECAEDIASAKAREEAATTELSETREKLARVQVEVEQLKNAICYLTTERDEAQDERDAAQAEVGRLRANGQAILDSSRPDDETIWREAFMAAVRSRDFFRTKTANEVLAEYRKRWPR